SSLNPKALGLAAAHGKGRTTINKRKCCDTDNVHNNDANIVNVADPTPDVPGDTTYFEDTYAHHWAFKSKVPTVVPHPNANSKGEWASIKGLFQSQAAAATLTQDQEQEQVAKVISADKIPILPFLSLVRTCTETMDSTTTMISPMP
ncbi:hypothetical protein BGZ97_010497, partial [Linnemannia gamsii]